MAKFLFHLGRWSYLHKKRVIAVWLILFATVAGLALTFQKGFNDVFEIQDVPSSHATKLLLEKFPDSRNPAEAADVNMVFQAPEGHTLDEPQYMEAMDATMAALEDTVPNFEAGQQFGNPVTVNEGIQEELVKQLTAQGLPEVTAKEDAYNLRVVSDDGRIGVSTFTFDVPVPGDVTNEDRETTTAAADISREAGLTVEIGGPGFGDPIAVEPISEVAGIIVALIILFFTFGSLLAAGLPLITAVVGVGIGALLTLGATALIPLNSITPTLGVMIGLAVGIDYALFIMSRYRDELRQGRSRTDAIGLACGTAGSAVIFAGATVIIALVGLRLADIPFLSYMGYFAAASVFIAVLVALTLLPALLGLGGCRIFKRDATTATPSDSQSDGSSEPGGEQQKHGVEEKWIRLVYRIPGTMIGVVMLSLALLTIPAMNLQLSLPNDMTANVDSTQRKSAELIKEGFGPGRNAPFLLVVNAENVDEEAVALQPYIQAQEGPHEEGDKGAAVAASLIYTTDQMSNNIGVQHAQLVGQSPDGTTAQILVTPTTGLRDEETVDLIYALRAQQKEIEAATGVDMGITGFIPILQDVTDRLAQSMPIYLALVVGLALVLLL
ncbi:MAG TPA: MMPL family transporter, partial [Candidatus Corynebacterium gallistercoris]|nr:MMPL family transporter [Candidatus Corynebacterium gallistercoris]